MDRRIFFLALYANLISPTCILRHHVHSYDRQVIMHSLHTKCKACTCFGYQGDWAKEKKKENRKASITFEKRKWFLGWNLFTEILSHIESETPERRKNTRNSKYCDCACIWKCQVAGTVSVFEQVLIWRKAKNTRAHLDERKNAREIRIHK